MSKLNEVKLVGMTKPEPSSGCSTANELIAYVARVSNPANQNNTESAPRLISYLIKHAHWSPFEMVHLTLEIKTTRDISRQILRHRSFTFQEFSQRYAESTEYTKEREARLQDLKNRQNSVEVDDDSIQQAFEQAQSRVLWMAEKEYKAALDMGIAKEQARALLPEGLTGTTLYMSGSLRSWIHYCELRMANGTQKEHMEIASMCWNIIKEQFPDVCEAVEGIQDDGISQ